MEYYVELITFYYQLTDSLECSMNGPLFHTNDRNKEITLKMQLTDIIAFHINLIFFLLSAFFNIIINIL